MGLFSKSKKTEKPTRPDKPAELAGNPLPVASPIVPTTTTSPQTDFRPVFLLIWPSATFKAHWAIFIPDADDRTYKRGRYIHVEGSLKEGFRFEIVRGWDISKSRRRPHSPIEIGCIPAGLVTDSATDDKLIKESIARDQIEEFFASIPPPSASLNSGSSAARGKKVELSDCQWWVTKCVGALVEQGMLQAPQKGMSRGKDPREILALAPRH